MYIKIYDLLVILYIIMMFAFAHKENSIIPVIISGLIAVSWNIIKIRWDKKIDTLNFRATGIR